MNNKEKTLSELAAMDGHERQLELEKTIQGTTAGDIWKEIKNLNIDMFALPNQKVHMHCELTIVEPSKLYLLQKSSSVLPALETAIGSKFQVELMNKYVVVSKA